MKRDKPTLFRRMQRGYWNRRAETYEAQYFLKSACSAMKVKRKASILINSSEIKGGSGMLQMEVGCGTGIFTEELAKTGCELIATDLSENMLSKAKERLKSYPNISFGQASVYSLPFGNSSFDVVVLAEVLQHIEADRSLTEVNRVLSSGGRVAFILPNILNPWVWLVYSCIGVVLKEPPVTVNHTFKQWKRILAKYGFRATAIKAVAFIPRTHRGG